MDSSGAVVLYVSMSLDGFATGPRGDLSILHSWAFGDTARVMSPIVSAEFFASGAVIIGKRTFDAGEEPWGDDEVFPMPVIVLAHERRGILVKGGTTFTFVDDGIESALRHARAAAGGRDVTIMGSPAVAQQFLNAGLVDELELHVVSVLLGDGTPLFAPLTRGPIELERIRLIESAGITHLRYRVVRQVHSSPL
jgi:dihydrofolate reductase